MGPASSAQERRGAQFEILASNVPGNGYKPYQHARLSDSKRLLRWRVKNLVGEDLELTFDDAETAHEHASDGYSVKWYKGKTPFRVIDRKVEGDGYEYTLPADGTEYFSAIIKTKQKHPHRDFCVTGRTGNSMFGYEAASFGINGDCPE